MIYGTKPPKCGRCHKEVEPHGAHFDGKLWYHFLCWEEGERELRRAEEVAARYGFPPSVVQDSCADGVL